MILTFFVVLRLRLKTQMRSFLSEYLEQKNKTFLRKLAQQNLAHRLSQKEPQAFQGTETLKIVFLFSQIFNFSFEQKKKKNFLFLGEKGLVY